MTGYGTCSTCKSPLKVGANFCGQCRAPVPRQALLEDRNGPNNRLERFGPAEPTSAPDRGAVSNGTQSSPDHARFAEGRAPSRERRYAAANSAVGNEAYLGHRLTYRDLETQLDDEVGLPELLQVLLAPVAAAFIIFSVFLTIGVSTSVSSALDYGSVQGNEGSSGKGWIVFGFLLALLAFVGLLRAMRADVGISEWSFLVDGKAEAASTAYQHIVEVLRSRQVPVSVDSRPVRDGRQHLVISNGTDAGFVAVYPYGTGLYLGWMLWRPQDGWDVVGSYLRQTFGLVSRMDRLLAATPTRALREAVHNATREGVDIAAEDAQAPVQRPEALLPALPDEQGRAAAGHTADSPHGAQALEPSPPATDPASPWDPFSDN